MSEYADFWRQARERSGLTQTELALSLGLKNGQKVSNIERGEEVYTIAQTRELIVKLDVSPEKVIDLIMRREESSLRRGLK